MGCSPWGRKESDMTEQLALGNHSRNVGGVCVCLSGEGALQSWRLHVILVQEYGAQDREGIILSGLGSF